MSPRRTKMYAIMIFIPAIIILLWLGWYIAKKG